MKSKTSEIKLGLLIIGGIVGFTVLAGTVVCLKYENVAKDIMTAVVGVAGMAISGILGWMGRGLYEAVKNAIEPKEEVK